MWLEANHAVKTELWVLRYRQGVAKPCIDYQALVEQCLCFGWIDSVIKKRDEECTVQRVSPRRKKGSFLSELNRQRVWKLDRLGRMTEAGWIPIRDQVGSPDAPVEIPGWIETELKHDPEVWTTFASFPRFYRRLKIGWITEARGARRRPEAEKRLAYPIKMTAQGRQYGEQPLIDWE